jgi:hypothetical protein
MGTSNLWQQNLNNMIKNFYYSVWTDCILQFQKRPIKKHWKFWSMFYISIAMGVNYMFLAALLPSKLLIPLLRLDIFHVKIIDIFLSSLIYFFSPWIFLNYFLIFWGNKYKKIIVNHRFRNGKLFLNYFFFSLFTPCLSLMIYYIIQKSK